MKQRILFPADIYERGMALLATVMITLVIMIAVGLSMVSSGILEGLLSESLRETNEAYAAAQEATKDALLKIARNKNFTATTYYLPSDPINCTMNGATVCARIVVEKDSATTCSYSVSTNQYCIIATGTLTTTTRTMETVLSVHATSGKITVLSQNEQ
ncbi:MAG: hypothetical protein AAB581_04045 [Patescibacteria group bacterium]